MSEDIQIQDNNKWGESHPLISVAVPSRHREMILYDFLASFIAKTSNDRRPICTVLHDAPDKKYRDEAVHRFDNWQWHFGKVRSVVVPDKSGLSRLYNLGIVTAPTDWVLLCNDDIEFKHGWLEYLEGKIAEGKHKIIHLFHYGAMLIHKSIILQVGWFDERFDYGGYEDNDYQLRIAEAGLKDTVDRSHDFIRREGGREIGHFVDHTKYVHNKISWHGDNGVWARRKWGHTDWSVAVTRQAPEIDWYPKLTEIYSKKFQMEPTWKKTTVESAKNLWGIRQ